MTVFLGARMSELLRSLMPGLVTLLLSVAGLIPSGIPNFTAITPMMALMSVYYWTAYRPDLLPIPVVFAVGLLQDILSGGPIGLTSLILLLAQWLCLSQRRFIVGKAFLVEWAGFFLIALIAAIVGWIVASAYFAAVIVPGPMALRFLFSVALYPVFAWTFGRGEQLVLKVG